MTAKTAKFSIPILPIPEVVFFPNTSLPILVTEPTYIKMIRDCVELGMNIGITMARPVKPFGHHSKYVPLSVGTIGRPLIVDELRDGTLKVLMRGIGRIQLEKMEQCSPFFIYRVSLLPDLPEEKPLHLPCIDKKVERLKGILNLWIEKAIIEPTERTVFAESVNGPLHVVDYLSMFVIRDSEMRQMLLENCDLYDRIQILDSLLTKAETLSENESILQAVKDYEQLENTYSTIH